MQIMRWEVQATASASSRCQPSLTRMYLRCTGAISHPHPNLHSTPTPHLHPSPIPLLTCISTQTHIPASTHTPTHTPTP